MKKYIAVLLFCFYAGTSLFSQNTVDSLALKRAQMKMISKSVTYHEYLTVFCGDLGFNTSHQNLVSFLDEYLGMAEKSQDFDNGHIISVMSEKVSKGKPYTLKIDYTVSDPIDDSGEFIIDKVKITGSFNTVVNLFIKYWATSLQTKDLKKNEWFYNYQAPDRIGLFITPAGTARIEITKM